MSNMYETIWNQIKSWFSQFLYKTKNISQNLEHYLNVLKTRNATKSKTGLKVSSKMIQKMSTYTKETCLEMILDTQPSPTKKMCAKR